MSESLPWTDEYVEGLQNRIEELERALRDTLDAVQRADFAEMERVARKARAVLEKKPRESRHYDRGFADALRLAVEYVRAWEENPMLISQKMVDTLAAGIEALTAALTPPQEKPGEASRGTSE